jgi:hypothetical protein
VAGVVAIAGVGVEVVAVGLVVVVAGSVAEAVAGAGAGAVAKVGVRVGAVVNNMNQAIIRIGYDSSSSCSRSRRHSSSRSCRGSRNL